MEIFCRSKTLIEPYSEIVDQTLSNLLSDLTNTDAWLQQETDEVKEKLVTVDEQGSKDEMF